MSDDTSPGSGDTNPDGSTGQTRPQAEASPDPWAGLVAMIGLGIVAVVAIQVLFSLAQTFAFDTSLNEPSGIPSDFLHRLGAPFAALADWGGPVPLVVGLVMLMVPDLLRRRVSPGQRSGIGAGVIAVIALAAVLSVGSLLAARNILHVVSSTQSTVPTFLRLQTIVFLMGSLGPSIAALWGSIAALRYRRQSREA